MFHPSFSSVFPMPEGLGCSDGLFKHACKNLSICSTVCPLGSVVLFCSASCLSGHVILLTRILCDFRTTFGWNKFQPCFVSLEKKRLPNTITLTETKKKHDIGFSGAGEDCAALFFPPPQRPPRRCRAARATSSTSVRTAAACPAGGSVTGRTTVETGLTRPSAQVRHFSLAQR